MSKLIFDEKNHIYYVDKKKIPSTTEIIQDVGISNFDWVRQDVLERATDFGTKFHKATDLYDKDNLDIEVLHPVLKDYLNQYIHFKEMFEFDVINSELIGYHKTHLYGFTIDKVGIINKGIYKGKKAIVDLKSGSVLPSANLQLAAYKAGYNDLALKDGMNATVRLAVAVKKSSFTVHICNNLNDFNLFISALSIYKFKKINNIRSKK